MTNHYEKIRELAIRTRRQRLEGTHHNGKDSEFPLVGFCFDNAFVMQRLLHNKGYNTTLIEGTTERVADELIQNNLDPWNFDSTDELAGNVHYWLEVTPPEFHPTYFVDIASDTENDLGQIVVTRTLPDSYIELPDSKTEGEKTLNMVLSRDDRCPYCGDNRYTDTGCQYCKGEYRELSQPDTTTR